MPSRDWNDSENPLLASTQVKLTRWKVSSSLLSPATLNRRQTLAKRSSNGSRYVIRTP